MSVLQYLAVFVYPGLMFGMMRGFVEHRWGERPEERTAVVESNWIFGMLFLWNNLHAVHHTFPTLQWWKVPRVWRQHREYIKARNGGFVFRGYGEIARRWLVKPYSFRFTRIASRQARFVTPTHRCASPPQRFEVHRYARPH